MEYTYFPNKFFSVFVSLVLIFMYCRYKFGTVKLIATTDNILHIVRNYYFLYFVKYLQYFKVKVKVIDLVEIYFLCHVPIFI
jgi:hypothetical protein